MDEYLKNALSQGIFSSQTEKTFIDKVLGRKDVEDIREIIKKKRLEREDLMHLMYMLSSVELKLLNYNEWDRYVMAKFFVWIRDYVAICESLLDYKERLDAKKGVILSNRAKSIFKNNIELIEHNIKFLIDLYFNLSRSTMSISATGFMELLKNKYEVVYPSDGLANAGAQDDKKLINLKWKR